MFDTFTGLPVHALVVHATVVLLPLLALITVLVAIRSRWRGAAIWVLGADLLLFVLCLVTKMSGQKLQRRLSGLSGTGQLVARVHGQRGALMPWFVLAMVVAAAVLVLANRVRALTPIAIALVVLTGAAGVGWTVLVGDSGARAVWEKTIANTKTP